MFADEVCRLCLLKSSHLTPMSDYFTLDKSAQSSELHDFKLISKCYQELVESSEDIKGSKICNTCLIRIRFIYKFREKITKNNVIYKKEIQEKEKSPKNPQECQVKVKIEIPSPVNESPRFAVNCSSVLRDEDVEEMEDVFDDIQEAGERSGLELELTMEETEEVKDDTYFCELCMGTFVSFEELKNHHLEEHNKNASRKTSSYKDQIPNPFVQDKTIICQICKTPFLTNIGLGQHWVNTHKGTCLVCGFTAVSRMALALHIKDHTKASAKVLQCKICRKNFKDEEKFTEHLQSHKGFLTMCCKLCESPQKSRPLLRAHVVIQLLLYKS